MRVENRKCVAVAVLVDLLLSGCSPAPPTLAGGKPVSYWIEALKAPDRKLRKKAAFKLGNAGPTDPAVLPALTRALQDKDAGVRSATILALLKFGAGAQEAIPALTQVQQQDRDRKVRTDAAQALAKLREMR
jgi:HEAT repeat protein